MLFDRHKRLLALLDAHGGELGNVDFQKLLFLYCEEVEDHPTYEFVPYRYGGFSFTSYADRRRLVQNGLLENHDAAWKLTAHGRGAASVSPSIRLRMDRFVKDHAQLRGDSLVAEIYKRYPYYAIRSEIVGRVLGGDSLAVLAIDAARPKKAKAGVCTIGYEGRSLEGYLNLLLKEGVSLLCDVRRNPLSRKYGFSKGVLSKSCEGLGIRYEHLPELGIASEDRKELKTQSDYDALFEIYERDSLPKQGEALAKIQRWIEQDERVALTCFEHFAGQCHRHCVAEALERNAGPTFAARHLQ